MSTHPLIKTETYAELYTIQSKKPQNAIFLKQLVESLLAFLITHELADLIKKARGFLISTSEEDVLFEKDLTFFLIFGETENCSKDLSLRLEEKLNFFEPIITSCVVLKRKRYLQPEEFRPESPPNTKFETASALRRLRSVRGALSHIDKILKQNPPKQIRRVIPLGDTELSYFLYNYDLVRLNRARRFLENRYDEYPLELNSPLGVRTLTRSRTSVRVNDSVFTYESIPITHEPPELHNRLNNEKLDYEKLERIVCLVQSTLPNHLLKSGELHHELQQLEKKVSRRGVVDFEVLANELGFVGEKKSEQRTGTVLEYLVVWIGIQVLKIFISTPIFAEEKAFLQRN